MNDTYHIYFTGLRQNILVSLGKIIHDFRESFEVS